MMQMREFSVCKTSPRSHLWRYFLSNAHRRLWELCESLQLKVWIIVSATTVINFHKEGANKHAVTGCFSPLMPLRQDRQATMSWARQTTLSLRSRPKASSAEHRNSSFSSDLQPEGQNQHMVRREHRAWTGDCSRKNISIKVVRQRHGRGASSVMAGAIIGMATAMAAQGTPAVVTPARSGSWWIWVPAGLCCWFLLSFSQRLCLPQLVCSEVNWHQLAFTELTAVSSDY